MENRIGASEARFTRIHPVGCHIRHIEIIGLARRYFAKTSVRSVLCVIPDIVLVVIKERVLVPDMPSGDIAAAYPVPIEIGAE